MPVAGAGTQQLCGEGLPRGALTTLLWCWRPEGSLKISQASPQSFSHPHLSLLTLPRVSSPLSAALAPTFQARTCSSGHVSAKSNHHKGLLKQQRPARLRDDKSWVGDWHKTPQKAAQGSMVPPYSHPQVSPDSRSQVS